MTTDDGTTEDRVRQFILEELDWDGPANELTDDYPLIDRDVIDSLGIFQIISFLESDWDIEVADEDLVPDNFASIAAIARLVALKNS